MSTKETGLEAGLERGLHARLTFVVSGVLMALMDWRQARTYK